MGMFDDPNGYNPADPNDQTQQYKSPSADPFAQFGITTPLQKDQAAYARQVQMQQQQMQMALQQQQLIHAQQQQSVDAASLASGYAFPTYLAMQAGKGVDNPMLTKGLSALGGMAAQGMGAAPRPGMQAPPMPPGMGGMPQGMVQGPPGGGLGGQPSQGMLAGQVPSDDRALILSKAMEANPGDSGKAYVEAGNEILRNAVQTGNEEYMRSGTAMISKGNDLIQNKAGQKATIDEKVSATNKNAVEAAKIQSDMTAPQSLGKVDKENGDTALAMRQYDPVTKTWSTKTDFQGKQLQRLETSTAAQRGEEVKNFQELTGNVVGFNQKIEQVKGLLTQGAATGTWASAGVGTLNNIVGTIGQLAPGTTFEQSAKDALNDMKAKGTFANWAGTTAEKDSVLIDLTMNLASTFAGPGGKVSNKEITRAERMIGENIGSPSTFTRVLDSVKERANNDYTTQYKLYKSRLTNPDEVKSMDSLYGTGQGLIGGQPNKPGRIVLPGATPSQQAAFDTYHAP